LWFVTETEDFFARMGCEPLGDEFTPALLAQFIQNRKVPIKTLLLSQNLIAGIGNIYADEALFAAGILPQRPAGSLTQAEIEKLTQSIKDVLAHSIETGVPPFGTFGMATTSPEVSSIIAGIWTHK
jgi:formamidopyrimidine-DNA glycosylase